ncbi:hypothetical protein Tco_0712254 [Tanacetum coccineum]
MKAYPKHIDWGKVIATNEIIDGYVMPIYGNKNLFEDDSWIDIIMDDVYHTFYRDKEEEAKVAKAKKFLAMVESEKARVKDYKKAKEAKKAREAELKAKEAKKAKEAELKAKKTKEAMLA